ncbi:MAG: hypothetical protein CVU60_08950 [Deltaproteobacteria bacterium HGW-Deltaproteobacteria-18]|nr:MAG: hypothetical protein CVU60_08950 [Deltaproteobacteria bacterium HGW-Deltaproteobacteria-18]
MLELYTELKIPDLLKNELILLSQTFQIVCNSMALFVFHMQRFFLCVLLCCDKKSIAERGGRIEKYIQLFWIDFHFSDFALNPGNLSCYSEL